MAFDLASSAELISKRRILLTILGSKTMGSNHVLSGSSLVRTRVDLGHSFSSSISANYGSEVCGISSRVDSGFSGDASTSSAGNDNEVEPPTVL